ncbi:MAG TPA: type IV toxin-antitoxin system AbiEi family antitoxin [Ignavibacteria bacterium]|nr:type IV toxin-antitoxin system AbiEi family antitoxin [Ignavibacteria bacterium]
MEKFTEIALNNLKTEFGIDWKITKTELKGKNVPDFDANIKIDGIERKFFFECKSELRNIHIPKLLELKKAYPNLIVLTNKYYPNIVKTLEQNEIGYADATGTVNIKAQGIRIYKEGTKKNNEDNGVINKYTPAGLKLIFNLLNNDEFIFFTYREMANTCNTALGNVNKIINKLKDENFIIKYNDKIKLNNKKGLLNIWLEQYENILKPKIIIGKYKFVGEDAFKNWNAINLGSKNFWGGEPAGNLLTNYLKPTILTLYTEKLKHNLIKEFKIIPEEKNFDLLILKKFWYEKEKKNNTAPCLLVYTDLINTKDNRNIETAQIIYDRYIKEKF